jgi:hypothetical protein
MMSTPELDMSSDRVRIEHHGTTGRLCVARWLFRICVAHLAFGKAVLTLLISPCLPGAAVAAIVSPEPRGRGQPPDRSRVCG